MRILFYFMRLIHKYYDISAISLNHLPVFIIGYECKEFI